MILLATNTADFCAGNPKALDFPALVPAGLLPWWVSTGSDATPMPKLAGSKLEDVNPFIRSGAWTGTWNAEHECSVCTGPVESVVD